VGWWSRLRVRLGPGGREALRIYDDVDGLLSVREAAWLYNAGAHAARRAERLGAAQARIVEIGSYRGKSFCLMARGSLAASRAGARITAIDPHFPGNDNPRYGFDSRDRELLLDAARRWNVAHLLDERVMTSQDALPHMDGAPIDLLWVDGDHSYDAARFDLESFGAFVRPGGVIAAHDYGRRFPGVIRAWDQLITSGNGWGPTRHVRSIAWATRLTPGTGPRAA
jgi:SAM-dependent methyltransferase